MSTALRTPKADAIEQREVNTLLRLRRDHLATKQHLELVEASSKELEAALINRLEAGASVNAVQELLVQSKEARHPHWKAHFAEVAGAVAAEKVLRSTPPTVTKTLTVKVAA